MSEGQNIAHDEMPLRALNAALREENDRLRAIVDTLKRALYGARSEKRPEPDTQLLLALGDLSGAAAEPAKLPSPANTNQPPRPKPARNIGGLPAHLPRVDITIEPSATSCPCCEGKLHLIGEDVSEMLDAVPAVLRVKRIHRPRYGCRSCEGAVVQAKAPPRPLDGGMPTAALLVHVAVMKFAWHLPLHRQVQMLAGQGIDLDVSTLVHWISRPAWWLKPLHGLLTSTILKAPKIFCDDTPLPVLDRTRRRTRIARLWSYAMDGHLLPVFEGALGAGFDMFAARQADLRPLPRFICLATQNANTQSVGSQSHIFDLQRHHFGTAQCPGKADQQQRAIAAAALAAVAGGDDAAQHVQRQRRGLFHRPSVFAQHALQGLLDVAMRRVPGHVVEPVHFADGRQPPANGGGCVAGG
jgi:transposase